MKKFVLVFSFTILFFSFSLTGLHAQEGPVTPDFVGKGTYYGLTPPLRSFPAMSQEEFQALLEDAQAERNRDLEKRSYPFAESALPEGPDPAWQREMGTRRTGRGLVQNFNGQDSPYYPPDANGTAGPLYYMQTINTVYAIYDKATGSLAAGPTNLNLLFSGVPGSNCNDGDPLVLYDEQADRWVAVEFSLCSSNDRMLVAVSQTNDPTGSWHAYSFDVADPPDYEKFGVWRDGYYMGTNTLGGNDIYVFERSQMLIGGTPQMVAFDNPWRPTTIDGFMCVPPVDNDGAFAPAGSPGLFITLNDDAIAGSFDALWIYHLEVDWDTPSNSTFDRVQQLAVPSFDSNFGNSWDNIVQPSTSQKLDAIPMVIMNRPQYRNFGPYETIVCCHTVDVDATNHAGIRWYELRKQGGQWAIRQSGTFAPDQHSRWLGSVALNGSNQIGMAYSISSATEYPGIRFCGQSEVEYAAASGIMDWAEEIIQTGNNSQTGINRWGDYADLSVDAENDHTFWFTSQYIGNGGTRKTKIAAFEFTMQTLTAMFSVSNPMPCNGSDVTFSDLSTGVPVSWSWTFEGGIPETSDEQNPQVRYDVEGIYDVTLVVANDTDADTLVIENFIQAVGLPVTPAVPSGTTEVCQGDESVLFTTPAAPGAASYMWQVEPPEAGTFSGNDSAAILAVSATYEGTMEIRVQAVNDCGSSLFSDSLLVTSFPAPTRYNMIPDGGFCQGAEGFEVIIDGSEPSSTYELFRDGISTGIFLPGYGDTLSFGFHAIPGTYSVIAHTSDCSLEMNNSTNIYYLPLVETAATPTGSTEECNSYTGTIYTTAGASSALEYLWMIEPPSAGSITGNGKTAAVDWSPEYSGTASIRVQGSNECGPGEISGSLEVNVIPGPQPEITGKDEVCNAATGNVYFYSTPDQPGNSYFWKITGGNMITGQGTNQVLVTWTAQGSGTLSVEESNVLECTGSQELNVTILDCTGIPDHNSRVVFLYPNPVEDELTIKCKFESGGMIKLIILNQSGQQLISRNIKTDNGTIDQTLSTDGLSSGTYSVRLTSETGSTIEGKFIKVN